MKEKIYYSYNDFLKQKFGCKIAKIPIDIGASCPNKLLGGCIYCKDFSKTNIVNNNDNVLIQFNKGVEIISKKYKNAKYIVYFQSGTNTYMPLNMFKEYIKPFLEIDNIVGISIATRCDAINDDYLKYFEFLNNKLFLEIELGLQSSNENSLNYINRGHNLKSFEDMVNILHKKNIYVCAHIINGLPYETEKDMLNTIKFLNKIKIDGIKIHMLSVLKNTKLAEIYKREKFHILTEEEYINIITKQIKLLNKNIVVERITADPIKEDIIEPKWYTYKKDLLNKINNELKK